MDPCQPNNNDTKRLDKEIDLLQNLRGILLNSKHELNNDLTKLAIKNLPIMINDDVDDVAYQQQAGPSGQSRENKQPQQQTLSQSTVDSQQDSQEEEPQLEQLEPLDLDL